MTVASKPGVSAGDWIAGRVRDRASDSPSRRRDAVRALLDTLAVALAAADEPVVTRARAALGRWGTDTPGPCTDWTAGRTLPAPDAALINGVASHALDYDDVWDVIRGHPSAVALPALIAAGEMTGLDGVGLLDAYGVALDVAAAVADALDVQRHYMVGWHATATVGVIGATAGVARLLDLDDRQTVHALGIATSSAAGSRQNFGSMTKPLHVGLAARSALVAGLLASEGLTADPHALDGPLGYLRLYGFETDDDAVTRGWLDPTALMTSRRDPGLNMKRYPCCYNTHRAVDAAIALHQGGVRHEFIKSVQVSVEPTGTAPLRATPAQTGLEAKFSGEYCVATALVDGHVGLAAFTDRAVGRADVRRVAGTVVQSETARPPAGGPKWQDGFAVVEVQLDDGTVVVERVDVPVGHGRRPLPDEALDVKLRECMDHVGVDDADGSLRAAIHGVVDHDVPHLTATLRTAVRTRTPEGRS